MENVETPMETHKIHGIFGARRRQYNLLIQGILNKGFWDPQPRAKRIARNQCPLVPYVFHVFRNSGFYLP